MDPKRRKFLEDKYPAITAPRPMDPRLNQVVQAMLAAEAITARCHGPDNAPVFDPIWSPAMYERADAVAQGLRDAMAMGDVVKYDVVHEPFTYDRPPRDVVLMNYVGSRNILVARRGDTLETRDHETDYAAGLLQLSQEVHDYYQCHCKLPCDLNCNVRISKACSGVTRLLPIHRGVFVLLFRCCIACESLARRTAEVNYKIGEIEARERVAPAP
jgi:hypothetical protein